MNPIFLIAAGLGVLLLVSKNKTSTKIYNPPVGPINLGGPTNYPLFGFPRINFKDQGQKIPLVIVLHGRNASEKQLTYAIPEDLKARIIFLRANLPKNVFFEPRLIEDPEIVAPAIKAAGITLANGINKLLKIYPTNKIILFGYSQGAELAEYMATLNWTIPLCVASFSGGLTENLFPTQGPQGDIQLKIWHGANDKIVPYEMDVATANAFKSMGYNITFETGENLSHVAPPKKIAEKYLKEFIQV